MSHPGRVALRHHLSSIGGVTLYELLIVVSVVLLLASLSVPIVMRHRMTANETAAAGGLKAIAAGVTGFHEQSDPHRFPLNLGELGAADPPFLDAQLASGVKSGYSFFLRPGVADSTGASYAWSAEAHPVVYRKLGVLSFYIDETGLLRAGDLMGERGTQNMPSY